ncbi:flavin-containing monooxygenase [Streptomyces marincola]|uniref:Monooxygenase n=1 Tax=Streptomyces marincola TaxID=2878388 RepID=A0A1W7D4Q6_9ACTN|nr:NAD(P)/FAD-dependent oxidoreductase [Streptomyces marincola]ARQ72071.1 monooxygenase [Streptomyces marincola]
MPHDSAAPPPPGPLEFDPDALRERYRAERDRRIRPDGKRQYRSTTGAFGYYVDDPYTTGTPDRAPLEDRMDAVIVGGGFGGLLAAARLRQAGLRDIRVIDRAGDFGGTWYWNRYPGIQCDIESYIYLPLLEEVGSIPAWKYAPGEDIRQHARAIGQHFGLYRHACFQTEVTGLHWHDTTREWLVSTDRGDRVTARWVVLSGGPFSRPKLPGIPGIEDYRGHTFHTSRWDYAYTGGHAGGGLDGLGDKRVGLIGTGATAIQCVPHLGRDARHLFVFQRTPSSVDVRANRRTDPGWARSLTPGWQRRRRDNFLLHVAGRPAAGDAPEDLVNDGWTTSARLLRSLLPGDDASPQDPEERRRAGELADFRKMNELRARVDAVVHDPHAAEALKPWYRYMCKRPTFSDTYLQTFNRANVTLVDTEGLGVERITGNAVVVAGRAYEVDCLIFATGFDIGAPPAERIGFPVRGRAGRRLAEHWQDGPRTLHGIYSHGFPNLFHLGSLHNAVSVNFVHALDEQASHIARVVAEAVRRGVRRVEPSADAERKWGDTIRETAPDTHRFLAECTPGYYNNEGMPGRRGDSYGRGPLAFHALLKEWRSGDGLGEVMVT